MINYDIIMHIHIYVPPAMCFQVSGFVEFKDAASATLARPALEGATMRSSHQPGGIRVKINWVMG